jgi:hypothetical protein
VVGAEVNVEDSTQKIAFLRPAQEVPGDQEAEGNIGTSQSAVWWSGTAYEGVTSYNDNNDECRHQGNNRYVKIPLPMSSRFSGIIAKELTGFLNFCHS